MPDAAVTFPDDARWRTATVSGKFDTSSLTWLRNRPVEGNPATHALAWFVTDDGRSLLVDAGWVEAEADSRPGLPSEHLNLTVTTRPTEADDGRDSSGTGGATRITPAQMPDAPTPMVPGYGVMSEACQDPCGALPGLSLTPLPVLGLGAHLAYTIQWYMLAVAAPIVAIVWIRREVRGDRGADRRGGAAAAPRTHRRRHRRRAVAVRRCYASVTRSRYVSFHKSSTASGKSSTRSGSRASTAPSSWVTSTTAPS